jgi:hypothetical protein
MNIVCNLGCIIGNALLQENVLVVCEPQKCICRPIARLNHARFNSVLGEIYGEILQESRRLELFLVYFGVSLQCPQCYLNIVPVLILDFQAHILGCVLRRDIARVKAKLAKIGGEEPRVEFGADLKVDSHPLGYLE